MADCWADMLQHHPAPDEPAVFTGFPPCSGHLMEDRGAQQRPLAAAWITEDLLTEAISVWSRLYQRRITRQEAIDMLTNVKNLGMAIYRIAKELDP